MSIDTNIQLSLRIYLCRLNSGISQESTHSAARSVSSRREAKCDNSWFSDSWLTVATLFGLLLAAKRQGKYNWIPASYTACLLFVSVCAQHSTAKHNRQNNFFTNRERTRATRAFTGHSPQSTRALFIELPRHVSGENFSFLVFSRIIVNPPTTQERRKPDPLSQPLNINQTACRFSLSLQNDKGNG